MSTPVDFNRELFDLLMARLENGMLEREAALELRPLVVAKLNSTNNPDLKKDLSILIDILDSYIAGHINLRRPPDVNRVSNVR
jgi:hypothetical protein